jgi:hypothetical protein
MYGLANVFITVVIFISVYLLIEIATTGHRERRNPTGTNRRFGGEKIDSPTVIVKLASLSERNLRIHNFISLLFSFL